MTDTEHSHGDPTTPTGEAIPSQAFSAAPQNPGRVLGIVGFVLSFFFFLNIAGLVLSIIGLVKSRRARLRNGLAVAGIIIASVGIIITIVVGGFTVPLLVDAGQTCTRLGTGVHHVGNATYTCTPTSFRVTY
ncbi:DUF4190 domain-containing protein [Subtercola frigoramans]|uniref:DUF4190 domain-containing protein n=1 Tax=Subtercola frigoramans TaxID=120298 RepID=A0ABS2L5Z0_9MICO|nr:DUF4190 domain-containing protein [Subtercola frigoramans]MBM7471901.1 hypothetical protein [Subtercola frigoramans]